MDLLNEAALLNLDDLIGRPIDGLSDEEALNHIGLLIDTAGDARSAAGTERAFTLLERTRQRDLAPELAALTHYFAANAWHNRAIQRADRNIWAWEQPEIQAQILELRRARSHKGFERLDVLRQCQVLTNLANQLDHIGRFIEAIELFDNVLEQVPHFAMALGNRGIALSGYARSLYDGGHAALLMMMAHDSLGAAIAQEALYDSDGQDTARAEFERQHADIRTHLDVEGIRRAVDLNGHSLGRGAAERAYRRWCLDQRLFLNPLNDIGRLPIAARDILTLPPLTVDNPTAQPPSVIGFFNQMKQEFVSARCLYYEAIEADRPHYSDREVLLYNTLDYPSYSLATEKVRVAYRIAYSLLDKVAFFLNAYLALGHKQKQVSFRKVWYNSKGSQGLLERFTAYENWPLRGLFWVSKDIFEEEFQFVTEPDAEALKDIRDHLEHKYLQLHESWAAPAWSNSVLPSEELGLHIGRDSFTVRALRVLKLARAALVYLSLAIHSEERQRQRNRGEGFVMTMPMDTLKDAWKI